MSMQDNPLYDQLSALLQKAGMLVTKDIPEARKNISVGELEVSIRIANIITNMAYLTLIKRSSVHKCLTSIDDVQT